MSFEVVETLSSSMMKTKGFQETVRRYWHLRNLNSVFVVLPIYHRGAFQHFFLTARPSSVTRTYLLGILCTKNTGKLLKFTGKRKDFSVKVGNVTKWSVVLLVDQIPSNKSVLLFRTLLHHLLIFLYHWQFQNSIFRSIFTFICCSEWKLFCLLVGCLLTVEYHFILGNNILYIGMYGPKGPCEEVQVKHMGRNIYQVNYFVRERGEFILIIKWGEEHIPGSPFRVEV